MDEEDLEEMYCSRLNFNFEPQSCPKKLLPRLANFMTNEGFDKKELNLVYRRAINVS